MSHTFGLEQILWSNETGIAARGIIPSDAEFFKDHFPGFPVLPGVLALELLRMAAEYYHNQISEVKWQTRFKKMMGVKFTHYLKPGDSWEAVLSLEAREGTLHTWHGRLLHEGKVAVSGRFISESVPVPEPLLNV